MVHYSNDEDNVFKEKRTNYGLFFVELTSSMASITSTHFLSRQNEFMIQGNFMDVSVYLDSMLVSSIRT